MKNCHLSTKWNILPEVTYHMRNLDSCNLFSWYTSLKLLPVFTSDLNGLLDAGATQNSIRVAQVHSCL